jgi:hypothetical protein
VSLLFGALLTVRELDSFLLCRSYQLCTIESYLQWFLLAELPQLSASGSISSIVYFKPIFIEIFWPNIHSF